MTTTTTHIVAHTWLCLSLPTASQSPSPSNHVPPLCCCSVVWCTTNQQCVVPKITKGTPPRKNVQIYIMIIPPSYGIDTRGGEGLCGGRNRSLHGSTIGRIGRDGLNGSDNHHHHHRPALSTYGGVDFFGRNLDRHPTKKTHIMWPPTLLRHVIM